ncbi:MAG: glycosyltransferase family 9 protein [Verrucomicrobiota bacterium]
MRILIHRLGSLGDTVVALPCFKVIRQRFPSAHIAVLTNTPVSAKAAPLEAIVENMGLIDSALYYPLGSRDWRKLARLHADIRRQRFDLLISLSIGRSLPGAVRDYVYFKTCGIRRIIGLPFAKRDRVCLPLNGGPDHEPEARRLLRRVRGIGEIVDGVDPNDPRWTDLQLTPEEVRQADALLAGSPVRGDFLVMSLGTKWATNDWGDARWSEAVSRLAARHPQLGLVVIGSGDERERAEKVLGHWKGPTANLCGAAPPRISAGIMRRGRLFLGHDSGPLHLAAASGLRCAGIFSARQPPGQWFPLGRGHVVLYPYSLYQPDRWDDLAFQRRALDSISVESVVAAVEKILG